VSFSEWLFSDVERPESAHAHGDAAKHSWWRVMCLTGVDYFSTLGYQSGIAFLAAGVLSPVATLVLVLVTLFAALPVYNRVAEASPYGQGSIAMLEKLFPGWNGKAFVLVLLGFATTDFIITMTLSAADAAAHFVHNPYTPRSLQNQMGVTLVLLAILGAIFLKGFKEAIKIAVVLVGIYLALNLIVSFVGIFHILEHPHLLVDWKRALFTQHGSLLSIIGLSSLLFPRLALGLSGFETGVAVMPLIECDDNLELRIRNTRRLLATAALIMSFFLMATSFITTLLIPAAAFKEGGPANGRAVAYLAHQYLGGAFGSLYDLSTILILAFAGASAMAGLLNLIPRYLPGFGMAPEWARASRPLVLVFVSVAFTVTWLFHANVDAQGGAYATGVLVLITSASCAVTIAARTLLSRAALGLISLIFIYTTLVNIYERPEGLKISCMFIVTMIFMSLVSRAFRSTELRIIGVHLDPEALSFVTESAYKTIRLIASKPLNNSGNREQAKAELREMYNLSPETPIYFVEVARGDTSDFTEYLEVHGIRDGRDRIFRAKSAAVPNSIAALLIYLEQATGCIPHAYFHWTDVNPVINVMRYIFLGEGDTAPLTHEVLRRAIKDPAQRPVVHVS
jgi:hypothetical protein